MIVGGVLFLLGLSLYLLGRWEGNPFSWLGRLPGDIRIERENFRFYFPVATSILISVVLSLLLYFFNRMR
jgi:hypothetical protein